MPVPVNNCYSVPAIYHVTKEAYWHVKDKIWFVPTNTLEVKECMCMPMDYIEVAKQIPNEDLPYAHIKNIEVMYIITI